MRLFVPLKDRRRITVLKDLSPGIKWGPSLDR